MSGTAGQNVLKVAREICPATTRSLLSERALLLDVRESHQVEVFAFDVPEILLVPMSELEQRWSEVPRGREAIVVCDVGVRSLKATYYLQYHGYTQVSSIGGGIVKWARKGFPVNGQQPPASVSAAGCCSSASENATASAESCCG